MKTIAFVTVALATMATALPAAAPKNSTASAATKSTTGYTDGNVANDVVNGVCAPLTVIFARGTTEKGNIGKDVGPFLFKEIIRQHGNNVALQGVDYVATWLENTHLGAEGGPQMAALVQQAQKQCPSTKITLGGYSQGAMVLHSAMGEPGIKKGMVQAAVAFGDPFNGVVPGTISKKLFKEFCGLGDNLCHHKQFSENVTTHTTYGMHNGTEAAKFLLDNMNSGGGSNLLGEIIDSFKSK